MRQAHCQAVSPILPGILFAQLEHFNLENQQSSKRKPPVIGIASLLGVGGSV